MLNICISFDYELFMGENRVSEEEILFNPTKRISDLLTQLGVSATFFADVCCPNAYRRFGMEKFADMFDQQLLFLDNQGHDVQLHIHPHWNKVEQIGRKIEFPNEFYRIHNFENEVAGEKAIKKIVHDGVEYLNKLLIPNNPSYRCVAYRAGGYCLQPEKKIAKILFEEGLRIDSSVCRGMFYNNNGMFYDYRNSPKVDNVFFNEKYGLDDNITQRTDGAIFEVPVASYSGYPSRIIAIMKNKKMHFDNTRGCYMTSTPALNKKMRIVSRIKTLLDYKGASMVTFDSLSFDSIVYMLNKTAKKYRDRDVFLATIAHPKTQSDEHMENMRRTISELQKNKYIRFVNMSQIASEQNLLSD